MSINANFRRDGGDVVVRFFSGVIGSHWMARLTSPGAQKQDYEGVNTDQTPDELVLRTSQLRPGALLSWWVVVFAPNARTDYTVTVTVTQGGRNLCSPISRPDSVEANKAEAVSDVIVFSEAS